MSMPTRVSRRTFCAAAAATLPFAALAREQQQTPRYIDVHTHLGQTWNHTKELTADGLLEWMDANGVERAVVMPVVSPEAATFLSTSEAVLEKTKPHRDRLIPFCCIDPRTSYSGGRHGLKHILNSYAGRGAKGFGEHKVGLPIDDRRSMEVYGVCGELGLPVLFHLDEQRNTDEPGLPGLERVLKAHPKTVFIGHGPGWWASISGDVTADELGGYPKKPVAPGGAMDRLMEQYPNLYGDLSAGSGAGALARDAEFGREFLIRRADRLLFGTDYLAPGQEVPQFELMKQMDLPPEVNAKVARENAIRVLRL
jgi:predicted TIM-barrel fold metal-dependent hydrolase